MIRNVSIEREYLDDLESVELNIGDYEIDSVQVTLPLQRPWTPHKLFEVWTCLQLSLPLDLGYYMTSFLQPTGVQVPLSRDPHCFI